MQHRPNRTWLVTALVLSILLLIGHMVALEHFWYWRYRWFDIPMHIIGGAAIGSFIFAFGTARRTWQYFLFVILLVIVWKLFEYYGHVSYARPYDWLGNLKDLVTSIIGAFIPFILGRKTSWR